MVEAILQVVVSPFLGVVLENLSSLIEKEVGLLWGVDKEMKKLASTLSTIRDVVEDAEEKQLNRKAIRNWLQKLTDAAYDADDILDEWATEAAVRKQNTHTKRVRGSILSCMKFEKVKFRRKIAKRMKELKERFDDIADERSKFHLRYGVTERRVGCYKKRETSSVITEMQVYGRDEDKDYIVGVLVNNVNSQDGLSIFPRLGCGGLGKTTVAQVVYNDERVKEHFEVRIWACVSEEFIVKRLTKSIISAVSKDVCNLEELDPLQRRLQESLAGKRYLLVLDDMWNENQEEWNRFICSMRCGAKGITILVTTRIRTVALITGTFPPCVLKFLSGDHCWSLFKQRSFGKGNEEIVKKCGRVPQDAKVLGGLLRFKGEENEWLFVMDCDR